MRDQQALEPLPPVSTPPCISFRHCVFYWAWFCLRLLAGITAVNFKAGLQSGS